MVTKNKQGLYACEGCGFFYKKASTAEQCEAWCKEHRSCNIEITKYAVSPS